ncbi:hypothetical protein HDU96_003898 [Phlyctochytrium bullatum]|nr:hypothetical protein HDU96_003898 [Phlyctochytrium bullatum]
MTAIASPTPISTITTYPTHINSEPAPYGPGTIASIHLWAQRIHDASERLSIKNPDFRGIGARAMSLAGAVDAFDRWTRVIAREATSPTSPQTHSPSARPLPTADGDVPDSGSETDREDNDDDDADDWEDEQAFRAFLKRVDPILCFCHHELMGEVESLGPPTTSPVPAAAAANGSIPRSPKRKSFVASVNPAVRSNSMDLPSPAIPASPTGVSSWASWSLKKRRAQQEQRERLQRMAQRLCNLLDAEVTRASDFETRATMRAIGRIKRKSSPSALLAAFSKPPATPCPSPVDVARVSPAPAVVAAAPPVLPLPDLAGSLADSLAAAPSSTSPAMFLSPLTPPSPAPMQSPTSADSTATLVVPTITVDGDVDAPAEEAEAVPSMLPVPPRRLSSLNEEAQAKVQEHRRSWASSFSA